VKIGFLREVHKRGYTLGYGVGGGLARGKAFAWREAEVLQSRQPLLCIFINVMLSQIKHSRS